MSGTWNDERVEGLKDLWADGFSASQPASKLTAEFDHEFTRNMVISKCHRLGLSRDPQKNAINRKKGWKNYRKRTKPGTTEAKQQPTLRQSALASVLERAPRESIPVADNPADFPDRVKLQQLTERSCRWPIGDPKEPDFGFCGKTKVTGLPYCEHHARRAYRPAEARPHAPKPVVVPAFTDLEKV